MKINWTGFIQIGARVFGVLVNALTPELRTLITDAVKDWEVRAEETPNPWDDMFVDVLKSVLNIK